MWWVYFVMPFGEILRHRPTYGYLFGYGHIIVFVAIAAVGAGVHILGLPLQHESHLGETAAVALLTAPVALYLGAIYLLHDVLIGRFDPLHVITTAVTAGLLAAAVVLAVAGAPISISLLLTMAAPFVTVIAYEAGAHRWQAAQLERLAALRSTHE